MRRVSFIVAAMLAIGAASAEAQTPVTGPYGEFTTGGAGSGALFGGEVGLSRNSWDFFFEFGRMLNTKSSEMDAAATTIAQFLGAGGKVVTFDARQPINYFDVGARYKFPTSGRLQPYAGLGIGGGTVSRHTTFNVAGTELTEADLAAMGVLLGGDLSGSEGGAVFMLTGGAAIPLRARVFGDVSYRYSRVFISGGGINTHRFQFGIGWRF